MKNHRKGSVSSNTTLGQHFRSLACKSSIASNLCAQLQSRVIFRRHKWLTMRESWRRIFFALAACSWVPHWSCHYYRLETGSSFAVGSWDFSRFDSALALLIYSSLILACLLAVVWTELQRLAALSSGGLHIALGALHTYRLLQAISFHA